MARKRRVWRQGELYHVMCRGNRRGEIFRDKDDYETYLRILSMTKERVPFKLLGYCLMTNHVHLQIQTMDQAIWTIMQQINMRITLHFNKKYNLVGHLFQGRYTAEIIDNDAYKLQTSRYIHLNPVKAGMVETPEAYVWSSYGAFQSEGTGLPVDPEGILGHFDGDRRKAYRKFVESPSRRRDLDKWIEKTMDRGVEP
ncbi:transposase [Anaerotalea alkaliphila]|uniref:Transposase n=1 Tax=Anaerotalea alkaliphila TaxID=2662126 RepID=A0A7X5HWC1_9FIRM|nr:transposase [Anaerotalea alkaliphila]NDL67840.1 transposase [Anaerotalea alkaliphila]